MQTDRFGTLVRELRLTGYTGVWGEAEEMQEDGGGARLYLTQNLMKNYSCESIKATVKLVL